MAEAEQQLVSLPRAEVEVGGSTRPCGRGNSLWAWQVGGWPHWTSDGALALSPGGVRGLYRRLKTDLEFAVGSSLNCGSL